MSCEHCSGAVEASLQVTLRAVARGEAPSSDVTVSLDPGAARIALTSDAERPLREARVCWVPPGSEGWRREGWRRPEEGSPEEGSPARRSSRRSLA